MSRNGMKGGGSQSQSAYQMPGTGKGRKIQGRGNYAKVTMRLKRAMRRVSR